MWGISDIITIGSFLVATLALMLFLLEGRANRNKENREDKENRGAKMTEQHSQGIIRRAIKRAQAIVGQAEVEGVKVVAASKFQNRELEEKFEKQMAEVVATKTDRMLAGFGKQLEEEANKETKQVKAELEDYKQKQMAALEGRIVAIVEKTVAKVLNKKLSFSQHADLVYEALEKAKAEEFI